MNLQTEDVIVLLKKFLHVLFPRTESFTREAARKHDTVIFSDDVSDDRRL